MLQELDRYRKFLSQEWLICISGDCLEEGIERLERLFASDQRSLLSYIAMGVIAWGIPTACDHVME